MKEFFNEFRKKGPNSRLWFMLVILGCVGGLIYAIIDGAVALGAVCTFCAISHILLKISGVTTSKEKS